MGEQSSRPQWWRFTATSARRLSCRRSVSGAAPATPRYVNAGPLKVPIEVAPTPVRLPSSVRR